MNPRSRSTKEPPPTTAPATTAQAIAGPVPVDQLRQLLERMKPQLETALRRMLRPDHFIRVALTTIQKTPKLQACTARSVLASLMDAAQLGLSTDPILGHAYLVPFKQQCSLIVGYRGFIELLMRTGRLVSIQAFTVRERDDWSYSPTRVPPVTHTPARTRSIRRDNVELANEMIAFYAIATLASGDRVFTWLWKDEVDEHRARSRAKDDGPWVTDYEPMAWKTVIRQFAKYAGLSAESVSAAVADEQRDQGIMAAVNVPEATDAELAEAMTEHRAHQLAEKYGEVIDLGAFGAIVAGVAQLQAGPMTDVGPSLQGEKHADPAPETAAAAAAEEPGLFRDPGQEG